MTSTVREYRFRATFTEAGFLGYVHYSVEVRATSPDAKAERIGGGGISTRNYRTKKAHREALRKAVVRCIDDFLVANAIKMTTVTP